MNNDLDELDGLQTNNDAMAELELAKQIKKLKKKIPEGIVEEIDAMNSDDLRRRIARSEIAMHETQQAMKADAELSLLKEKVKEMAAPFKEARATQKAISEYAAIQLMKKGKES